MEISSSKSRTIKRILRDLHEFHTSPIEGLGLCLPDESNPFELRANLLILDGIYKGILLHLIMNIPENYPLKAPKLIIAPGQEFDHTFHHHIFQDPLTKGYTICIDLLDHGYFSEGEKTGWTPAYTLSTILIQMQIFFAKDYDLIQIPSFPEIEKLKQKLYAFKTTIKTTSGLKVHSFYEPYPQISKKAEESIYRKELNEYIAGKELLKNNDEKELLKKISALEKMTCYLTRCNAENGDTLLGYPMKLQRDKFGRIHIVPILEVLSYEGYTYQLMDRPQKVFNPWKFDEISLRTALGCEYNYWFPIFTSEKLYKKHKQHVFNSFSVLKFGVEGKKEYDFEVSQILNIFPCLMNKMIVNLLKGVLFESVAAIEAYCHFLRLFIVLLDEFPELKKEIEKKVEEIVKDPRKRNKKNLGDMGEFLILLAFSSFSLKNSEIWEVLIVEFISRQFYWVIEKIEKNQEFFIKEASLMKLSYQNFFTNMNESSMKEFYQASKVSNNLLLFNISASERFLRNSKEFVDKIERNYGVIEEIEVKKFIDETNKLKESVDCYEKLLKFVGLEALAKNDQKYVKSLFSKAWKNSVEQNYNRNYC